MHYTETEVKLDVWLSDIPFQALELHISPETAVIRAKSLLDMVEGFFSAEHLEGIIPFPVAVHPETVSASLQHNLLSLTLPKSGQIERQRLLVRFNQVLDPSQSSSGMRRSLTFKGAKS
jgi:HSP20 family molecular chaperone IbpA